MGREDEQPTRQDVTLGYPSNSTRTYPGQTKVFRPLHGAHGGISFLPSSGSMSLLNSSLGTAATRRPLTTSRATYRLGRLAILASPNKCPPRCNSEDIVRVLGLEALQAGFIRRIW